MRTTITSHELAKKLLALPDLPFCSSAHGHIYSERMSMRSHGPLMIGILQSYAEDHIIVGDMLEHINNGSNWSIKEILDSGRKPDTRRDVETAIDLQKRYEWDSEDRLAIDLEGTYGWNHLHAIEIAELAWVEMYAEKEGE